MTETAIFEPIESVSTETLMYDESLPETLRKAAEAMQQMGNLEVDVVFIEESGDRYAILNAGEDVAAALLPVEVAKSGSVASRIVESLRKGRSFRMESKIIARNKRGPAAAAEHPFQRSTHATRKGAFRCLTCGRYNDGSGDTCPGLTAPVDKTVAVSALPFPAEGADPSDPDGDGDVDLPGLDDADSGTADGSGADLTDDAWAQGLSQFQADFVCAMDDLVQDDGQQTIVQAGYEPVGPDASGGLCCGNCIAYNSRSCDWVQGDIQPGGACRFVTVPAQYVAIELGGTGELVKRRGEMLKAQPDATSVHTDTTSTSLTVGYQNGSGRKRKPVQNDGGGPHAFAASATDDTVCATCGHTAQKWQHQVGKAVAVPSLMRKALAQRFTLGPWYIPDTLDAHGEWTDPDELQQALWSYVQSGDRNIRLQHQPDIVAGEWVEAMMWPYDITLPMIQPDTGQIVQQTFPAGTVFLGVIWAPWAWELVLQGLILGFSIGGSSNRVTVDLPAADVPSSATADAPAAMAKDAPYAGDKVIASGIADAVDALQTAIDAQAKDPDLESDPNDQRVLAGLKQALATLTLAGKDHEVDVAQDAA